MKQLQRFLFSFLFVSTACGDTPESGEDTASPACMVGVDASVCQSADELKACAGGTWQYADCEVACEQAGMVALGCGADPESGEAACLCGDGGVVTSGGGDGDGGNSGGCEPLEGSCEVNGDCCGGAAGEAYCVNDGTSPTCLAACLSDDECGSGCCADLTDGTGACAPSEFCAASCSDDFAPCENQSDCCGYPAGNAFCVNDGSAGSCRPSCILDSDCASDCCAELESGDSVCAPADVCGGGRPPPSMCLDPGEMCVVNGDCCGAESEDAYCVNYGNNNVVCAASCFTGDDCISGCCAALEDGTGACSAPQFCGRIQPGRQSNLATTPLGETTFNRHSDQAGRLDFRVVADSGR